MNKERIMALLQKRPKLSPTSSMMSQRKRKPIAMFIGAGVTALVGLMAFALFALPQLTNSHAAAPNWHKFDHDNNNNNHATTIGGLHKIRQIGSTAKIINANG